MLVLLGYKIISCVDLLMSSSVGGWSSNRADINYKSHSHKATDSHTLNQQTLFHFFRGQWCWEHCYWCHWFCWQDVKEWRRRVSQIQTPLPPAFITTSIMTMDWLIILPLMLDTNTNMDITLLILVRNIIIVSSSVHLFKSPRLMAWRSNVAHRYWFYIPET